MHTDILSKIRESRQIFLISVIVVTGFVALIAFLASYQHQYELVIRHHQTHWVAGLYPLSVDLLIVAATMVIWYAASQGWGRPWGAWLVLLVGIAATAIANLAADNPEGWNGIGPFISIWPAVAFLGAYEMAVWVVRKRRKEWTENPGNMRNTGKTTAQNNYSPDANAGMMLQTMPPLGGATTNNGRAVNGATAPLNGSMSRPPIQRKAPR